MSENHGSQCRENSQFDGMTTEELEDILRADAALPDGEETDTDKLFYIMEVLAERKSNDPGDIHRSAEEAYASFRQNYLPDSESEEQKAPAAKRVLPAGLVRVFRTAAAVAAVAAIVFCGTMAAYASGVDVWGAVAKWTKDTFHFENAVIPGNTESDVQKTEEELLAMLPAWIPDGFEMVEKRCEDLTEYFMVFTCYRNGEDTITVWIGQDKNGHTNWMEKDAEPVEVYESNGVLCYLFEDIGCVTAAWKTEDYACTIVGDISRDEVKKMIDSMNYK